MLITLLNYKLISILPWSLKTSWWGLVLPVIDAACNVDEWFKIVQENRINCSKRYDSVEKCEKDLLCDSNH